VSKQKPMPADLPASMKRVGGEVKKQAWVPTICCKTCPKCGRGTYITKTDDVREPYNKVGCFIDSCNHVEAAP
jgi:hypothetical protein